MKTIITSAILIALATLTNCGSKDPAVTESQCVTTLLKATTWKIQSLMVDGADQSTLFKNFTISFSDKGFTTTNGGVVWPATGTWTFVSDAAKSFTRDDGTVVSIDNVTDTALTLSLTWTKTTLGGGRVESISGKNVFVLTK